MNGRETIEEQQTHDPKKPSPDRRHEAWDEIHANDPGSDLIEEDTQDEVKESKEEENETTEAESEHDQTPVTNQDDHITNKENESNDTGLNINGPNLH